MIRSRRPAPDEAWEATVTAKTRGNPDGANLYHYLEIELLDGTTRKIRVGPELWESVSEGDTIVKHAGAEPARR